MLPRKHKRTTLMPAVVLAVIGALIALPALSSTQFHAAAPSHFAGLTVLRGDTLWSIAESRTAEGGDVQATIDRIVADNHLTSASVVPGEHLKIPR